MSGASCSGGAVLAVISAAPVAQALCSPHDEPAESGERPEPAGRGGTRHPSTSSSSPWTRTASSARTL